MEEERKQNEKQRLERDESENRSLRDRDRGGVLLVNAKYMRIA